MWAKEVQPLGALANKKKREGVLSQLRDKVAVEVGSISLKEMDRTMLSLLYWAEGAKGKGSLAFANTDPERSGNKRFRENKHGICFLIYHDVNLKDEILIYAKAISDKITGGSKKAL